MCCFAIVNAKPRAKRIAALRAWLLQRRRSNAASARRPASVAAARCSMTRRHSRRRGGGDAVVPMTASERHLAQRNPVANSREMVANRQSESTRVTKTAGYSG